MFAFEISYHYHYAIYCQDMQDMQDMLQYSIIFVEGDDYNTQDITEHRQIIKSNFCLLSWFIPHFKIRIKELILTMPDQNVKIFTRHLNRERYYIHQRRNGDNFYYFVGQVDNGGYVHEQRDSDSWSITAKFQDNENTDSWSILITWKREDLEKIFLINSSEFKDAQKDRFNYFKPPCKKVAREKLSLENIQYCYIQPENQRYFEPQGYHINLAFQGGGAKGVSYVGVNQAIKDLQQRIQQESQRVIPLPIMSVIGSSAGGILSLAISAGIQNNDLIDLCYMMDTLVEDILIPTEQDVQHISNDPRQFNQKYSDNIGQNFFQGQEKAFKNVLHNLGLVQDSLSDIIFETLRQPSVQERIFALFTAINPSIASLLKFKDNPTSQGESIKNCCGSCCCCCYSNCWTCCGMYPCCQALPGTSCFIDVSSNYRKVNIYGLLYGALMTGTAVENILAYALSLFLKIQADKRSQKLIKIFTRKNWVAYQQTDEKKFQAIRNWATDLKKSYLTRVNNEDKQYLDNPLIRMSKELTLLQYYELTGVQFTCTSVDLNDKILRFFNHKTTPGLPVCKAVQMTGSFPAAFLSLKWKKEWGKYYVHYDQTRREIDLEGHHFTDGGLLANFPLKFLDNEKFRQKYFSHKKVENKTILYGFGLDQLQDFPENNNSETVDACLSSLFAQFKYRLMYKLVIYLAKCSTKDTLDVKNVKLLDFLVSLVDALRQSDRNLNKQCYKEEIIETVIDKMPIQTEDELKKRSRQMITFLNIFSERIQLHFSKQRQQFINDEINAIYSQGNLSWKQIEHIQWTIQDNLLQYSQGCVNIYQDKMRYLKEQYSLQDFYLSSMTSHHQQQILGLLYQFKQILMSLSQYQFNTMKDKMRYNYRNFYDLLRKICEGLVQSQSFNKQKQAVQLLHLKYKLSPYVINIFNQSQQSRFKTQKTLLISYFIEEYTYLNRTRIRNQIRHQINEAIDNIPKQAHVILQARQFSHLFFPNYIKIVEEVVSAQKMEIGIISCSDFHAIFGVLYVMGYETLKIKQQLANMKNLFKENSMINQNYASKEWMKTTVEQIKTLLKIQWERTDNPFDKEYKIMNNTQIGQLREIFQVMNQMGDRFENIQEEIDNSIEKILNYLTGSFQEILKLSGDKRKDRFEQLLGLGKYEKLNKKRSKLGQKVLTCLLRHTVDLLMLTAQFIFKSQQYTLFSSKKWNKQTLFKGMVLNSLLNASEYKMKIFEILEMAGLDTHISLQKFYDVCPKKIILNFNVANTSQQRFALINKFTKPNMPLWAALMASASLPYLQGEFGSRMEWEMKQKGDIYIEQANLIFQTHEVQGSAIGNSYISGNFISSLPLEFMTNQRLIMSKLSDETIHKIEIIFAFQANFKKPIISALLPQISDEPSSHNQIQSIFTQLPKLMQGNRKFLNCRDLCEFLCCWCCSLDVGWYFSEMFKKISTFKMLNIRINSHDNLIMNLYYDKLIKLPLRIGTLDFYKINRDRPDLKDTIMQAKEVVRQLCDTVHFNQQTGMLQYSPSEKSTIQVSYHYRKSPYLIQSRIYRLKFISYSKWRDIKYKYVIQYSLSTTQLIEDKVQWSRVRDDYIDVPRATFINNQWHILLRFRYYENKLISHSYLLKLKNFDHLSRFEDRAIFEINYRKQIFEEKIIQANNQTMGVTIKPYFLSRGSDLCTNPSCKAYPLTDVLFQENADVCSSCTSFQHQQDLDLLTRRQRLIAMKCQQCSQKYCLKCKVSNFIRKSIDNAFVYDCPRGQNKKYKLRQVPIILNINHVAIQTSNCLFCGKYAYLLRCEQGISEANLPTREYCGLRICETCTVYVTS